MSRTKPSSGENGGLLRAWTGRTNLSTYVKILHLLEIDLLQDWPNLSVQTFSTRSPNQNLQYRVKAVEWSLFRLLELYDPQTTRDVGLQSKNMRAALLMRIETSPILPTPEHPTIYELACSSITCFNRVEEEWDS